MSYLPTIIEQGLQPLLIDEVASESLPEGVSEQTYLAIPLRGDTTKCILQRIQKTGTVTRIEVPHGQHDFKWSWDLRTDYMYELRKY